MFPGTEVHLAGIFLLVQIGDLIPVAQNSLTFRFTVGRYEPVLDGPGFLTDGNPPTTGAARGFLWVFDPIQQQQSLLAWILKGGNTSYAVL